MRRSLWILLLGLVFSGSVRGETYPWSDREAHFRAAAQQTPASDAVPIWKNLEYKGRHFRVAATMLSAHAELVDLLLKTESMDDTEQQYWFDLYPSMEARQIDRLYEILRTERQKLAALDAKYAEEIRLLQADRPVPEEPAPFSERTTELGLVFVRLPGGRFRMGCDDPNAKGNAECWSDEKWSDGKAQHEVEISAPFWLGKYEVTQKQWRAVMGDEPMQQGNSRSAFLGDDKPVGYVSYNRILEFIDRLNAREGRDGSAGRERYRLPTEAEWEYAARAGTQTPWSCGSNARCLNEMGARFNRDWDDGPVAVGQSGRNDWGLYGMHGNVWEWVSDVWSDPRKVTGQGGGVLRDPWVSGDNAASRVLRGGYWVNSARGVRSASRYGSSPGSASRIDGFRLALSPSHS